MPEPAPVEVSAPAPQPPGVLRRWLAPLLKIALAVGLIWYVLAKGLIDFNRLGRLLNAPGWLGLGILLYSAQLWLGAQRLRLLLSGGFVNLSYLSALRLTYIGAAFDVFLVTSVGGDAVKAVYLARETPDGKRTGAISVLVLDRLLGLFGILSLTLFAALWQGSMLWQNAELRPYIAGLIGVSAGLSVGMLMLLSAGVYQSAPMQALLRVLPFGGVLNRAYGALQSFRAQPRLLLAGWLLSLAVHTVGVAAGYALLLGLGLGDAISFGAFFVSWLIAVFVCSFAAFGGIGLGQLAYDKIFMLIAGMAGGADVATAAQIAPLLAKAPGLLVWLMSREHVKPVAAEEPTP